MWSSKSWASTAKSPGPPNNVCSSFTWSTGVYSRISLVPAFSCIQRSSSSFCSKGYLAWCAVLVRKIGCRWREGFAMTLATDPTKFNNPAICRSQAFVDEVSRPFWALRSRWVSASMGLRSETIACERESCGSRWTARRFLCDSVVLWFCPSL